jgi:hypothetical protein
LRPAKSSELPFGTLYGGATTHDQVGCTEADLVQIPIFPRRFIMAAAAIARANPQQLLEMMPPPPPQNGQGQDNKKHPDVI